MRFRTGHPLFPLRHLLLILLLSPLLALAAQTGADEPPTIDALRDRLSQAETVLAGSPDDTALVGERDALLLLQGQASSRAAALEPQLASLDARLAELEPSPDGGAEADELRATRDELQQRRASIDAEIRQARVLAVEAAQTIDRITAMRQAMFKEELYRRSPPLFSATFWRGLERNETLDTVRWQRLGNDLQTTIDSAAASRGRFIGLSALALLIFGASRWGGERLIRRKTSASVPGGRLRRSALAVGITALSTVSIWICAHLVYAAVDWSAGIPERIRDLAQFTIALLTFSVLFASLGRALLACSNGSWRLLPLSDEVANALRFLPALLAAGIFVTGLMEHLAELAHASLSLSIAISSTTVSLLTAILVIGLWRINRARRREQRSGERPGRTQLGLNILVTMGWLAVLLSAVALLTGFVSFAAFVSKQAVWTLFVLSLLCLSWQFSGDLVEALFRPQGLLGRTGSERFGIGPRRLQQVAVVLTAALRVALAMMALTALVSASDTAPGQLLSQLSSATASIAVGELTLSPGALVRALLVFAVASALFRLLQHWFGQRFLPTTELEPGMQSSLSRLVGYVGGVIAVAMALAAIGVSLERITWVVSALSVGIGFGLQAIVQNFISGLILLVERPVKVGDWVVVGDAEGDVQRINVRTTEIRTGDRVTILVPNSELITKVVRNRTRADAEGLVSIQLPMPLATDADMLRTLVLDIVRSHPDVLPAPAPAVVLDDIGAGRLLFKATAFVRSPRQAGAVRGNILFEILRQLQLRNIPMHDPQLPVSR